MTAEGPLKNPLIPKDKKESINATQRLTELQKDIPRASLIKELKAVEGGDLDKDDPSHKELNKLKIEINALVAFSIQEIWNGVKNGEDLVNSPGFNSLIKENENNFATLQGYFNGINSGLPYTISFNKNPKKILTYLEAATQSALIRHMENWEMLHEQRLSILPEKALSDSDRVFKRYKYVLAQRDRIDPTFKEITKPNFHIAAGIQTAMDTIWKVLAAIPRLYGKKFNKTITAEEFKNLAQNSISLILKVAGSELNFFRDLRTNSEYTDSDVLCIRSENGNLRIELTPFATEDIKVENPQDRLRTGCPAIIAKGSDGTSMMFEMHQWILDIAKEFYFPLVTEN